MKKNRKFEYLISAYIDDSLEEKDKEFVEKELLIQSEWERYYRELKTLRNRMRRLPDSVSDESVWPMLQKKLHGHEKQKKERTEILPKKLIPVVTVLAMIVVGLGSFTVMRNWDSIASYYHEKRIAVEDIYEQGIVQGALRPLFASLTNDDMLQFALSGIISIPDADGHSLKIESDSTEQYELEITDEVSKEHIPSLAELSNDLSLTERQLQKIDSVLSVYRERIAQSVFIHDDKEMMVSPELVGLDKFILASVANELQPVQRTKFNSIVSAFNSQIHIPDVEIKIPQPIFTYSYATPPSPPATPAPASKTAARVQEPEKRVSRSFIIFKSDTVLTADVFVPSPPQYPSTREAHVQSREVHERNARVIAESMQNTRIRISPFGMNRPDSVGVQVFAYVGSGAKTEPGAENMVRIESHKIPRPDSEYFLQLREISKEMHRHTDAFREARRLFEADSLLITQFRLQFDGQFREHLEKIYEELGTFSWEEGKVYLPLDSLFSNEDLRFRAGDREFMEKLRQHLDSILINTGTSVSGQDSIRIPGRR
jgi:hypothetical protein